MATLRARTISHIRRLKSRALVTCARLEPQLIQNSRIAIDVQAQDPQHGDPHYSIEMSVDEWLQLSAIVEGSLRYGTNAFPELAGDVLRFTNKKR